MMAAFPSELPQQSPSADDAEVFAELLFRRGRIDTSELEDRQYCHNRHAHKTHRLVSSENGFACKRIAFDCGFGD